MPSILALLISFFAAIAVRDWRHRDLVSMRCMRANSRDWKRLGLRLGSPHNPLRTYFEGQPCVIPKSEPFLAPDVRIVEGGGFRAIYFFPSVDLVIFRNGETATDWDAAFLVNDAIRGTKR